MVLLDKESLEQGAQKGCNRFLSSQILQCNNLYWIPTGNLQKQWVIWLANFTCFCCCACRIISSHTSWVLLFPWFCLPGINFTLLFSTFLKYFLHFRTEEKFLVHTNMFDDSSDLWVSRVPFFSFTCTSIALYDLTVLSNLHFSDGYCSVISL